MSVRNVVVERADGVRDTAADVYGREETANSWESKRISIGMQMEASAGN